MRKWISAFVGGAGPPAGGELPLDPLSADFVADPAPIYAHLRETSPLAPMRGGGYLLTRAADIEAAFTDPNLGNAPSRFSVLNARNREKSIAANLCSHIPPFQDKPHHPVTRRALSAAFYDVFSAAEHWVPDLARETLSGLPPGKEFDVIADFAGPFAARAMARFIGLPEDLARIREASGALFTLFAPIQSREALAQVEAELSTARAFVRAASESGETPRGTLMAELTTTHGMEATVAGDNALLVLADGIENIEAAVAAVMLSIAASPDWMEATLRATIGVDEVVAEALRLNSPAQIIPRVVRTAHDRQGVALREGTPLFLALGSAARDPEVFDDPDSFDPKRDQSRSMVFGRGRHSCIGAPLGRLLVQSTVAALIERRAALTTDPGQVRYHARFGHRWPVEVRARLGA